MTNPLVSIVICCHNRAHLLPQTMESVFAQQYEPVEIVVIDDGSTDNTSELMAGYADKIRYYRQENSGAAATRTAGCRLARGEYIAFQDDDDLMPPDRIVRLHKALCQHPSAVFALGDWALIDADGNLTGKRSKFNIHVDNGEPVLIQDGYRAVLWPEVTPIPHTTLFRKTDGERIGWFDMRFFNAIEDTDFFARLGKLGPILYVPQVLSYYRQGHGQMMGKSILLAYNRFLLFEKHLRSLNTGQEELRKRLQWRMSQTLRQLAVYESKTEKLHDSISTDRLKEGLSLLGLKDQLVYRWLALIKLPLRRMLLGRDRHSKGIEDTKVHKFSRMETRQ